MWPIEARNAAIANHCFTCAINRVGKVRPWGHTWAAGVYGGDRAHATGKGCYLPPGTWHLSCRALSLRLGSQGWTRSCPALLPVETSARLSSGPGWFGFSGNHVERLAPMCTKDLMAWLPGAPRTGRSRPPNTGTRLMRTQQARTLSRHLVSLRGPGVHTKGCHL